MQVNNSSHVQFFMGLSVFIFNLRARDDVIFKHFITARNTLLLRLYLLYIAFVEDALGCDR